MVVIDIVIVGMWAIIADQGLECRVQPPAETPVSSFAVVALDPGILHPHSPTLWIRRDSLVNAADTCYLDKGTTNKACSQVTVGEADKWWAKRDLRGKELKISQPSGSASIQTGKRRVTPGNCWMGKEQGIGGGGSCDGSITDCGKDASWIPEYSKAAGDGTVDPEVLSAPEKFAGISAIAKGLIGRLEARTDAGKIWKWMWNHAGCAKMFDVKSYEQRFNKAGRLTDVSARDIGGGKTVLLLVDIVGFGGEKIEVKQGVGGKAWIELYNVLDAKHDIVDFGGKCLIPHFAAHQELLLSNTQCRRIPYFDKPGGGCGEAQGGTDPICPPVLLKGP